MKIETKIRNEFLFEVRDAETGELKQTAKSHNIILDEFFVRFKNVNSSGSTLVSNGLVGIRVGKGTGTLDPKRTDLFNPLVTYGGHSETWVDDRKYSSISIKSTISSTQLVGETITEVGLTRGQSNGTRLISHSLLKDMNGNPISIYKTDTDIITITATIYIYYDRDYLESQGVFDSDIQRRGLCRLLIRGIGTYNTFVVDWALDAIPLSGKPSSTAPIERLPSNNPNFDTLIRFNPTGASYPGISYFRGNYISYIPNIIHVVTNKTVGTGDGVKTDFSPNIATFLNPRVYIDSVETTDFTVLGMEKSPLDWLVGFNEDGLLQIEPITSGNGSSSWPSTRKTIIKNMGKHTDLSAIEKLKIRSRPITVEPILKITIFKDTTSHIVYDPETPSSNPPMFDIPINFRDFDYIEVEQVEPSLVYISDYRLSNTEYGIRFNTPPEEGATITMTYDTPRIPKDDTNVIDLRIQFSVNEYSG